MCTANANEAPDDLSGRLAVRAVMDQVEAARIIGEDAGDVLGLRVSAPPSIALTAQRLLRYEHAAHEREPGRQRIETGVDLGARHQAREAHVRPAHLPAFLS